jgi:antitoxin PrlF
MQVRSKVTAQNRTVLPRQVRERLQIRPGDYVCYIIDESGVRLHKDGALRLDAGFSAFSEWASEADEKAYADL